MRLRPIIAMQGRWWHSPLERSLGLAVLVAALLSPGAVRAEGPKQPAVLPTPGSVDSINIRFTARAASDTGLIVGGGGYKPQAVLWSGSAPPVILSDPSDFSAIAFGVNNLGQVVGGRQVLLGPEDAFLWTAQAGLVGLGTLGG